MSETLKVGQKKARVTGFDRTMLAQELTQKYVQGASIRSLAEEFGRSYGFVHRLLCESQIKLRSRGGPRRSSAKS